MIRRFIAAVPAVLALVVSSAPAAPAASNTTITITVEGRLLGEPATVEVYDGSGSKTVTIHKSAKVRVRAGSTVEVTPRPIRGTGAPSTATVQTVKAKSGTVVGLKYRRDVTSLTGPLEPVAGTDAWNWHWAPSPDGRWLAFDSSAAALEPGGKQAVFLRDLASAEVSRLATGGTVPVWSPDSQRIAFTSDQYTSDVPLVPEDLNDHADVYVVDIATRAVTLASTGPGGQFAFGGEPAWLDDDRILMRACLTQAEYDDWVLDGRVPCGLYEKTLSTGAIRRVVPGKAGIWNWSLSPDGTRLVFTSTADPLDKGITKQAIYVTKVATGNTALASSTKSGKRANKAAWGAAWSPDSRRIAFSSTADNLVSGDTNGKKATLRGTDVFVKDLRSGKVTRISTTTSGKQMTGERGGLSSRNAPAAQWAPNGKGLAFRFATTYLTGDWGSRERAVFIKTLKSGRLDPLVPGHPREDVGTFAYSPDSRRIAFIVPGDGCGVTDLVPFADLNSSNVLVVDRRSGDISNISTRDDGMGWRGGCLDREGDPGPVMWLGTGKLLFQAPDLPGYSDDYDVPVMKTPAW